VTHTNHVDRPLDEVTADGPDGDIARRGLEASGELLERVRDSAVKLLADVSRPPRALRVRIGDVALDVEWDAQVVGVGPAAGAASVLPAATGASAEAEPAVDSATSYLHAPTVGVFYLAPEPNAPPFVGEGDTVVPGQQVGIVEAMKLMIPVQAETGGRVVKVLKENGEPVEYGERLFALAALDAD
jgi:acetyl-CoA carboxylase biotin carboxyl carrier protein